MRYLIIGNGAAGNAAAAAVADRDPAGEVIMVSDEPEPAYYRPLITNHLETGGSRDIAFSEESRSAPGRKVELGKRVIDLDAGRKVVIFQDNTRCSFDRLLLATGASAILPDIPGLAGPGTSVFRTLADARALSQAVQEATQAVVIGGGRVGLKAALALRHRGLGVTIVEQGPHLIPLQFDAVAGEIGRQALEAEGIRLIFGHTVAAAERSEGRLQSAVLTDGRALVTDIIVAAVGVQPNVELAQKSGLAIHSGVLVDVRLRTSNPEIYAAGDVAETTDMVTGEKVVSGLWTNAMEMGRIAGRNMAGAAMDYEGAFAILNAMELAGIPTVAVGLTNPPVGGEYEVYQNRRGNNYRKLVFRHDVMVGALLVGDIAGAGIFTGLIRRKAKMPADLAVRDHGRAGLVSWLFRPGALPSQQSREFI